VTLPAYPIAAWLADAPYSPSSIHHTPHSNLSLPGLSRNRPRTHTYRTECRGSGTSSRLPVRPLLNPSHCSLNDAQLQASLTRSRHQFLIHHLALLPPCGWKGALSFYAYSLICLPYRPASTVKEEGKHADWKRQRVGCDTQWKYHGGS
jgi:hypothetical protein